MLLRALWRWRHPPPPLPARVATLERFLAGCTHAALYVVFIAMPLAGYINAAAAGHAVSVFGIVSIPPLIPENNRLSQAAITVHLVGQYFLYLFVLLHIAGGIAARHRQTRRRARTHDAPDPQSAYGARRKLTTFASLQ